MDDDHLPEMPRTGDSLPPASTNHSAADTTLPEEPALNPAAQRVATLVREVELPADETTAAQERVRARLLAAMNTDNAPAPLPAPRPLRPRPSRRLTGIAAVAAIILLSMSTGIGLSSAAAGALPSSPFYGLKRAGEWVALHTAWSDQRRGEVLVAIAQHRVSEIAAESSLGHTASATALSGELRETVLQVIHLTADMSSRHDDIRVVSAGLVGILAAELSAQATATQAGDTRLVQALQQVTADEAEAIANLNLQLPFGTPGATDVPGQTPPAGGASHTPTPLPGQGTGPTPVTTPRSTPTGQPTPTRDGDGDGNGGTGSGGHGKPTPTPTGTAGTGRGGVSDGSDAGYATGTGEGPSVTLAGAGSSSASVVASPTATRSGSHPDSTAAGAPHTAHTAIHTAPPLTTSTHRQQSTQARPGTPPSHAGAPVPAGSTASAAPAVHGGAGASIWLPAHWSDFPKATGVGRKATR